MPTEKDGTRDRSEVLIVLLAHGAVAVAVVWAVAVAVVWAVAAWL